MTNIALISIHPEYADKIVSGEKRWEFRRAWAKTPVDLLVVYSTAPIKRITAILEITEAVREGKDELWKIARDHQGGISRKKLFAYFNGKKEGIALRLNIKRIFKEGIDPKELFGDGFRPPQSFQYMSQKEWLLIEGAGI